MSKSSAKRSTAQKKPVPVRRSWLGFWIIVLAVILVIGLALWQGLYRPIPVPAGGQMLRVKSGETYSGLIRQLNESGQLRLPILAKLYQRLFIHDSLKAGVYRLESGQDIRQVMQHLSDGSMAQMVRITVIEGSTFAQLAQRLAQNNSLDHQLTGLDPAALMKKIGASATHPEGWFAPDTYYFAQGESDLAILKHLYQNQVRILDEEWAKRADGLPYRSAKDALIMASIVEKETGVGGERADVAAVFVNRLRIGMRLQTDPTVIYGMGAAYNGNITRQDLQTVTAYNTYQIDGLPPTPIALPSRAAIHAALHPSNINALYFVATGTGGHKFSRNLAEHNAAVAEYLKVLRQKRQVGG